MLLVGSYLVHDLVLLRDHHASGDIRTGEEMQQAMEEEVEEGSSLGVEAEGLAGGDEGRTGAAPGTAGTGVMKKRITGRKKKVGVVDDEPGSDAAANGETEGLLREGEVGDDAQHPKSKLATAGDRSRTPGEEVE